jgi:hypothetical protein
MASPGRVGVSEEAFVLQNHYVGAKVECGIYDHRLHMETVVKIALAAAIVTAVAFASKRSSWFGALVASVPLTSLLAMIWLYTDTKDVERVAGLSMGIFWLVIPSLALFVVLALLLRKGVGFYPSLLAACLTTVVAYAAMSWMLSRFGIRV